jgi:hypothetical protein
MKTRFAYDFPSRRRLEAVLTHQAHNVFTHEKPDDEDCPEGGGRPPKNNVLSGGPLSQRNNAASLPCWNKTIFRRPNPPKSVIRKTYCDILFRNEGMRLIVAGKEGNRGNPE